MAGFKAQVVLIDSMNREVTKTVETQTDVLSTAQSNVAALLSDLAALTDLGIVKVAYSLQDASGATAPAAGSNRDVGATFKLRTTDGGVVSYKIPGFDIAKADGSGNIDPNDVDVVAYFDNFKAGGPFTLGDGEKITDVLSGTMDK